MTYRTKMWLLMALAFGGAAIGGLIMGRFLPASGGVENPALVLPLLLGLGMLILAGAWPWWNKTDDLQKQGQLISWWWGGTAGALAMLIVLITLTGRHSDMSLGAIYIFMAEFAGMVVAYLVWKIRGRGAPE